MRYAALGFGFTAVLSAGLVSACSLDGIKRTGYETLESMRQQQCMDDLDRDCSEARIRYDSYEAERKRLQQAQP